MKPQELMFHSVGERMHQRTTGSCKWGVISVDPEFFARLAKLSVDQKSSRRGSVEFCGLRGPKRERFQSATPTHQRLSRIAETKPQAIRHREVARAIENDIIDALVNCLIWPRWFKMTQPYGGAMLHMMESSRARWRRMSISRLTIPELCKTICVAERSLRMCCFNVRHSPSHFIRLRRLNLVHMALQHADPTTTKISEIAARSRIFRVRTLLCILPDDIWGDALLLRCGALAPTSTMYGLPECVVGVGSHLIAKIRLKKIVHAVRFSSSSTRGSDKLLLFGHLADREGAIIFAVHVEGLLIELFRTSR